MRGGRSGHGSLFLEEREQKMKIAFNASVEKEPGGSLSWRGKVSTRSASSRFKAVSAINGYATLY